MTTAMPMAMSTGMAIPVGRPPGGIVIPCSWAYAAASAGGHG